LLPLGNMLLSVKFRSIPALKVGELMMTAHEGLDENS
jgi:hypothetical protein